MLAASEKKIEKDYTEAVDAALPSALLLAQSGKVLAAVESLLPLEKQTRGAADQKSNTRVLSAIVSFCGDALQWKLLNDQIVVLCKKHGFLKHAVQSMVQLAMTYVDKLAGKPEQAELIDTLRTVTEGKIFLEVERARVTRTLSQIKEKTGKTTEACDILQELQVETFGSMDKREKTDFILEQMRLTLAKLDYTRVVIISKKINSKFFTDPENQDLKLRFCYLMIQHALHENDYLAVAKYYSQIYETPSIKDGGPDSWKPILENIVLFTVLSPFDNEQSDMINRLYTDTNLSQIPLYKDFCKCFITVELMRWSKITEIYATAFRQNSAFTNTTESGIARWGALHKRVSEHNIRVISKYYSQITIARLTILLDLPLAETEAFLSDLVCKRTIWAKIDRPAGRVTFKAGELEDDVLNVWSGQVKRVLGLIGKTGHLISKEEMVNEIIKVST